MIFKDGLFESIFETGVFEAVEIHDFAAEASTLGIKHLLFLKQFRVHGLGGNGQPFFVTRRKFSDDGDLLFIDFVQGNGCIKIRIYND